MANISISRLYQLEQAERQLAELQKQQLVIWVGEALGKVLATILANRPFAQWTAQEKRILSAVCGDATTAKYIYISLLPKE